MDEIANSAALPKTASESQAGAPVATVETVGQRIGRYRWVICALLFFATTVNYVDRQVLGILSKDLKVAIGWTEVDYGNIIAAFNAAYAFGLLLAGRLMDRIGTRAGYAISIVWWSLSPTRLVPRSSPHPNRLRADALRRFDLPTLGEVVKSAKPKC